MAYKVTWAFGDGANESQTFDNEGDARIEAHRRSTEYALEYGRCNSQIHNDDQLVADLTETYYG
jgi:hypothetical protein